MSYSFISIPRTGSNSVCEALGLQKNHWSHKKAEQREFMFAFFRHPADRLVSWWEYHTRFQPYLKQYQVVFPEWIMNGCPGHHTSSVTDVENSLHQHQFICDEVTLYDFDKIQLSWLAICKKIGASVELHNSIPTQSIRRDWEEYYNRDLYAITKELFAVDWKIYEKINPDFVERSDMHFA